MFAMKKILLITVCLLFSASLFAQDKSYAKEMITKIDSIAKANNITIASVENHAAGWAGQKWTDKVELKFDGPFLVIANVYLNMDKLLYFTIKETKQEKYFYFVFQENTNLKQPE